MKQCKRCLERKDEREFYKDKRYTDGFNPWCKTCQKTVRKANYLNRGNKTSKPVEIVPGGMKRCSKCKELLGKDNFSVQSLAKDGLNSRCKGCMKKYRETPEYIKKVKEWKEKNLGYSRQRLEKNPERIQQWKEKNLEQWRFIRARNTLRHYGLIVDEDKLIEFLKHRPEACEICGRMTDGKELHIDHDHRTGELRGFICNRCNYGLLGTSDDPIILRRAIHYLETTWQQRLKKT